MKSLAIIVLLSAFVACNAAAYRKSYNSSTTLPHEISASSNSVFSVNVADSYVWDSKSDAALSIRIFGDVSTLEITITPPGKAEVTVYSAFDQANCSNCNDANVVITSLQTVIDKAEMEWTCRKTTGPCVAGTLKPANSFTTGLTNAQGTWVVKVSSASTEKIEVARLDLIVGNDFDDDSVTNEADLCPLDSDADQTDSDDDGKGDACQCTFSNHHVVDGFEKQCVLLGRFGNQELFYKGVRKNTGDWWPVTVVPSKNRSFKPGDYTHKSQWLNCNCETYKYVPATP